MKLRRIRKEKPAKIIGEKSIVGLDIVYPVIPPYAFANIKYVEEEKNLVYFVIEPTLAESEKRILKKIENIMIEILDVNFFGIRKKGKAKEYMEHKIEEIIREYEIEVPEKSKGKIKYYIIRDFVGFGKIDVLMNDPNLEDISCDGVGIPIYVVHRNYGSIRTNVSFEDSDELDSFVIKLAQWCGRHISVAEPLLDGALPDGSRVQATFGSDVTKKGSTFSIRKFREIPMTPLDLIENNTADSIMMAYLWFAIENRASILISGGTATGKTTMLNALSLFIRPEFKIVSIEDTPELNLPHEHWIPAVARPGYGPPEPTGERYGEVTMFDLLKSALRQRPDYIIVGEVRGKEAFVLFQGMATGHAGLATIHADSVESLIQRLTTPPINLSPSLLQALDIILFLTHARVKEKPARRVSQVVEITGITPEGEIETGEVFRWHVREDIFEFTGRSKILSELVETRGELSVWLSETEIWQEIEIRKSILEWMIKKGIRDYESFTKTIMEFYRDRENFLKKIERG